MGIQADDFKSEIPGYLVSRVESDQPSAFEDAARKASLWMRAREADSGLTDVDLAKADSQVLREATIERAKYELYSMIETEDVAADKKENSMQLADAVLDKYDDEPDNPQPAASATEAPKPGWMGGFEGRRNPERDGKRRIPGSPG